MYIRTWKHKLKFICPKTIPWKEKTFLKNKKKEFIKILKSMKMLQKKLFKSLQEYKEIQKIVKT